MGEKWDQSKIQQVHASTVQTLLCFNLTTFLSFSFSILFLFLKPRDPFSRMRSEGFSFNSWGSGVEPCSRSVVSTSATVRNRSQPFATVRNRPQPSATVRRRCHWGKLLQVTMHGCVTCEFATLFHCDLREKDMSRKKRDAFRCTGAAFCEIRRLLRSSFGISVWRVVFLGCWTWPCHWDLRFRVWHRSSVFVSAQNGSKSIQTCGVVQILLKLT